MTNPLAQDLGGVVLLPCPFCGSDAKLWVPEVGDGPPAAMCTNNDCDASVYFITPEHWNTRAHSAEIAGALRDAERYRWLRSANANLEGLFSQESNGSTEMYSDEDLDTAIDSAMHEGN